MTTYMQKTKLRQWLKVLAFDEEPYPGLLVATARSISQASDGE
jgi:hypothetical protein